jgi:hypothetical protein
VRCFVRLLVGSGYEVVEAGDGREGVAKTLAKRPDLMSAAGLRRIWVVAGAVGAWRGRADAPTGQFPSLSAPRPLGEAVRPEKNREDWRGGSAANAPRSYRHPGC